jgi:hypothetical protein
LLKIDFQIYNYSKMTTFKYDAGEYTVFDNGGFIEFQTPPGIKNSDSVLAKKTKFSNKCYYLALFESLLHTKDEDEYKKAIFDAFQYMITELRGKLVEWLINDHETEIIPGYPRKSERHLYRKYGVNVFILDRTNKNSEPRTLQLHYPMTPNPKFHNVYIDAYTSNYTGTVAGGHFRAALLNTNIGNIKKPEIPDYSDDDNLNAEIVDTDAPDNVNHPKFWETHNLNLEVIPKDVAFIFAAINIPLQSEARKKLPTISKVYNEIMEDGQITQKNPADIMLILRARAEKGISLDFNELKPKLLGNTQPLPPQQTKPVQSFTTAKTLNIDTYNGDGKNVVTDSEVIQKFRDFVKNPFALPTDEGDCFAIAYANGSLAAMKLTEIQTIVGDKYDSVLAFLKTNKLIDGNFIKMGEAHLFCTNSDLAEAVHTYLRELFKLPKLSKLSKPTTTIASATPDSSKKVLTNEELLQTLVDTSVPGDPNYKLGYRSPAGIVICVNRKGIQYNHPLITEFLDRHTQGKINVPYTVALLNY